ncbi:hypothetical protein EJ07DRAFT_157520 [Lizonia empirigonia]|nr:hypothetical protein EJ07DRAFT_157520 [Lizonia empirigonia]
MASTPATLIDGAATPASATHGHHHHHPHLHGAGTRIRQLLRPDGSRVHIAGNPDEARRMSQALRANEKDDFDLVLHGSPEHRTLSLLSSELHKLSLHAVPLSANVSTYGNSAHQRTQDGGDAASEAGSAGFDKAAWQAGRTLGLTMRVVQTPIVRQGGDYELFVDLVYVGIVAVTGDAAADGESLLGFAITFVMGWKFWSDISLLISWFDGDDVLRRCSVLFILTCLLGFTTNMVDAFEHTYTPLVAFYLTARLFLIVSLFWYAYLIPMVRAAMIGNGIIALVPAALWIGSIPVEEPGRQGLIWTAIAFDLFGGFIAWRERLEFFPGTNIEHGIERTNAFVTLVFGSCVLGILYQSSASMGVNAFFGKAVLGLIQAFTFNWIYFEIDSFNLHTHAIRRHIISGKSSTPSSVRHNTNPLASNDLVLHPPALHHVLRPQRRRARRARAGARLRQHQRRLAARELHPALRGPHISRPATVLLRRPRGIASLSHHPRGDAHAPQDAEPAHQETRPPRVPRRDCDRDRVPAAGAAGQLGAGGGDDGAGGERAGAGAGGGEHVLG